MIFEASGLRIAIEPARENLDEKVSHEMVASASAPMAPGRLYVGRIDVEILGRLGGNWASAALSALVRSVQTDEVLVDVDEIPSRGTWPSLLGQEMEGGLPSEFVAASLGGVLSTVTSAGHVLVDSAGWHTVQSSPVAFNLAGRVMGWAACSADELDVKNRIEARLRSMRL